MVRNLKVLLLKSDSAHTTKGETMQKLKKLALAVSLTVTFAVTVSADDRCGPPEPGQTNTPPCVIVQQTSDDQVTQDESTAPSNYGVDVVAELAIGFLETVLPLF